MIKYSIKTFSTRMKKKIMEFLSLFSLQERMLMSHGGVNPKAIYACTRWNVNGGGMSFLLFKENTLVGLITIHNLNKSVAALDLLAIKPSEQRKGLGTFLLKYILEVVKLNGMREIRGKVVRENEKAISFYKKFDFIFADGGDDYLISKSLVSSTVETVNEGKNGG